MKRGRSTWREASNPCSTTSDPGDPGHFADTPPLTPSLSLQLEMVCLGLTPHTVRVIVSLNANGHSQVSWCLSYAHQPIPHSSTCWIVNLRRTYMALMPIFLCLFMSTTVVWTQCIFSKYLLNIYSVNIIQTAIKYNPWSRESREPQIIWSQAWRVREQSGYLKKPKETTQCNPLTPRRCESRVCVKWLAGEL